MRSFIGALRQHVAALRMLIIFTVVLGVAYPLFVALVAQIPALQSRADGSQITINGKVVGSKLLGQSFTDKRGNPLVQYFQPRPSAAGDGYDPTASSASNLGLESIVDTLPNPSVKGDSGTQSLLTQVCSRSLAIGKLEGVDGSPPFCTPIAKARGITVAQVDALVHKYQKGRDLSFLGEPRINVLQLNLALDRIYPDHG